MDEESLRVLQDEVHAVLVRLRDDALRCTEPDPEPVKECVFDESGYDDPLACRILLPVPGTAGADGASACVGNEVAGEGATDDNLNAVIDYYVRDPSRSACRNNPVGHRCLTNKEVDASWKGKLLPALQVSAESE